MPKEKIKLDPVIEVAGIRTYNFPQSRITDHRINYTSHALTDTLMGELDHLIDALQEFDQKSKLNSLSF